MLKKGICTCPFKPMLKKGICTRTATRIGRNADKEHKENNPKMPRQKDVRVPRYSFALSLHSHVWVLSASCQQSAIVCVFYVCMRVAVLFQSFAIVRFTVEFGAKKIWHTLPESYLYRCCVSWLMCVCVQTLYCFLGGLSRNWHFRSTF